LCTFKIKVCKLFFFFDLSVSSFFHKIVFFCIFASHEFCSVSEKRFYMTIALYEEFVAQSRQSAKHFLQSSELALPQPLTRKRVCTSPPPFGSEGDTLARGRWDGVSQFGRGDRNCGTLNIDVLCCLYLYCKERTQLRARRTVSKSVFFQTT
jgi:hypothetical protein